MKKLIKTHLISIALVIGNSGISWSSENGITKIICELSGEGKLSLDDRLRPVKVEQKIEYDKSSVLTSDHHFISDYDFLEHFVVADGRKYGWLIFNSLITEDKIRIFSEMTDKPKKSTSTNVSNHWYILDMTISRKTGRAVRKMNYTFTIDGSSASHFEYNISGDCRVRENKF